MKQCTKHWGILKSDICVTVTKKRRMSSIKSHRSTCRNDTMEFINVAETTPVFNVMVYLSRDERLVFGYNEMRFESHTFFPLIRKLEGN